MKNINNNHLHDHFFRVLDLNNGSVSDSKELCSFVLLYNDRKKILLLVSKNYSLNRIILDKLFCDRDYKVDYLSPSTLEINKTIEFIIDNNIAFNKTPVVFGENEELLEVRLERLINAGNARLVDLGLKPKYKAKTLSISPISMRETFEQIENPFFGISLENSCFTRPKLIAQLTWVANRFRKCSVLIGDSIHRITLNTNGGLLPNEARDKALHLGKNFMIDLNDVFARYKKDCDFNFIFCSDVQKTDLYYKHHQRLVSLFDNNEKFKHSVINFASKYHLKKIEGAQGEYANKLIKCSCDYFLEEFAIFACLSKEGHKLMIYPGSFSTLSEIAAGQHQDVCDELKELAVVSLHIKKR